ncbi:response regulator [Aestuariivita sp.]|jgi:DNA-binding response OmpR family regulator|uniref:response regulator n=1 Tax=Aestuariivita sp. TaxID=1872407 RepID=UPI00216EF12D|nr:response regulator [Aestuariivita sp.]MCE8008699.1 response regulator [Aestuariivita sp.]
MDDSDLFALHQRQPTASRPLLGLTILVVEDSRYASEAMRLLCLRSGARIRRADSLRAARRHLQVYRPSVIIVDLGLPDGSGLDLIAELNHASPRVAVLLANSGDDGAEDAALNAGADGFLAKPIRALSVFQEAVLSRLPADRRPPGPRQIAEDEVDPDPMAFRDDMAHAAEVLTDARDGKMLDYAAQFLNGVAISAQDDTLAQAARQLADIRTKGGPVTAHAARVAGLVQDRLQKKWAM